MGRNPMRRPVSSRIRPRQWIVRALNCVFMEFALNSASAAIPSGIAGICNQAARPKPGCAARSGAFQRCLDKLLMATLLLGGVLHAESLTVGGCTVDDEIVQLPRCSLTIEQGQLYLRSEFLKFLFPGRDKHLVGRAVEGENGYVYFNRCGRAVIRNVAMMDNGADYFQHGIVRVVRDGKWGLANQQGKLIVPLRFDGILPAADNQRRWAACTGCKTVTDAWGEHSWFEGGTWFWIDTQGRVTEQIRPKHKTDGHRFLVYSAILGANFRKLPFPTTLPSASVNYGACWPKLGNNREIPASTLDSHAAAGLVGEF